MTKALIKQASDYCEQNKYRLTEPRLQVLKIIASSVKPLGAYEILDKLGQTIKNPKPPTAYRAIDFWQEQGFIHRIESINAYVSCEAGHRHQGSQFMICDQCGFATEIHMCHLPDSIQKAASDVQFVINFWNLELNGQCRDCS